MTAGIEAPANEATILLSTNESDEFAIEVLSAMG